MTFATPWDLLIYGFLVGYGVAAVLHLLVWALSLGAWRRLIRSKATR